MWFIGNVLIYLLAHGTLSNMQGIHISGESNSTDKIYQEFAWEVAPLSSFSLTHT